MAENTFLSFIVSHELLWLGTRRATNTKYIWNHNYSCHAFGLYKQLGGLHREQVLSYLYVIMWNPWTNININNPLTVLCYYYKSRHVLGIISLPLCDECILYYEILLFIAFIKHGVKRPWWLFLSYWWSLLTSPFQFPSLSWSHKLITSLLIIDSLIGFTWKGQSISNLANPSLTCVNLFII